MNIIIAALHVGLYLFSNVIHVIWTHQGFMSKIPKTHVFTKMFDSCRELWETNYLRCYSWCRAPGCDIWPVQRSSRYGFWWGDPLPHSLGTETDHLWLPLPSTQRACHHRQQRYTNYLLNCYNAVLTFVHKHSVSPKTVMTMNSLRIQLATWKCYISFMRIMRKISWHWLTS